MKAKTSQPGQGLIRQDKVLAGATSGGNFGCGSADPTPLTHPDRGMSHEPMANENRAAPPPIKHAADKFPGQANPDHGPHRLVPGYGRMAEGSAAEEATESADFEKVEDMGG